MGGISPSEMLLGKVRRSEGNGAVLPLIYFDFPLRNKLVAHLQSKSKRPLTLLNSEKSCASDCIVSGCGKGATGLEKKAQSTRTRWSW